ncbi:MULTISPECIES: helix-turn-helix domain-containing protein [Delftia]|nr:MULTISPECIES: helix-turn-helix transcriptional regulator [Delftia]
MEALALELKVRRRELGLTQEDLAGRCNLDRPYISLIEVARKQPTLSVLYRLSEALELPLSCFMGRVQARYQNEHAMSQLTSTNSATDSVGGPAVEQS